MSSRCYARLMKPLFKWGAAGVAVLVVAGAALWASQRGSKVQVSPVVRTGIVQSVVATGRLNAPARMDIGSEVIRDAERENLLLDWDLGLPED